VLYYVQRWLCTVMHTYSSFTVHYFFTFAPCWRLCGQICNNLLSAVHTIEDWSWCQHPIATRALLLLFGHQEEHLTCKNWVMRCFYSYLSGARCNLLARGSVNATASKKPVISCLHNIQNGFTFLVPAYSGCPGKEASNWVFCLFLFLESKLFFLDCINWCSIITVCSCSNWSMSLGFVLFFRDAEC